MRVLIACEFSGNVRAAFRERGHFGWSCDIQPARDGGQHIQADVRTVLGDGWDLMIAHPPCKYLSYAGARWFHLPQRQRQQALALEFFRELLNADIPQIAIENPRGVAAQLIRKPDDVIEPFMFGEPAKKRTYLWLKDLPPLMATLIVPFVPSWTLRVHGAARSVTFPGIAKAMAEQWG